LDITYIQTKEGFVYLTTIMDLYYRKIIGWILSGGMNIDAPNDSEQVKQTTLGAWKMPVRNRNIE
jgi:putative transposase